MARERVLTHTTSLRMIEDVFLIVSGNVVFAVPINRIAGTSYFRVAKVGRSTSPVNC